MIMAVKRLIFMFKCWLLLYSRVHSQTEGDQVYYYEYPESSASGIEPAFDVPIINVTVVEGQSAVLPCSVEGMTKQMIIWLAPNNAPITIENTRVFDDTRFNIIRNNNNAKEWNLHIADIKYEDRGTYKCTINTQPVKHKMVILHVQVPPKVEELSTSKDLVVREGQNATIHCNITGVPTPTISWFVRKLYTSNPKKTELDASGTSIQITNTSRLSDAEYECMGENGIPPAMRRKIGLTIEFKPRVSIINPRLGQVLGKETMLDCVVEANPQATITWYKEGTKVVSSVRTKLDPYEELAYRMILSLRISNIRKSDYGFYECEARNRLGSSTGSMELYEYKPKTTSATPTQLSRKTKNNRKNKTNNNQMSLLKEYPSSNHTRDPQKHTHHNPYSEDYYGNQLPHYRNKITSVKQEENDGIFYKIVSLYGNSCGVSGVFLLQLSTQLCILMS